MESLTTKTFLFAEFELDAAKRLLLKNGQAVPLNSKSFDLLFVLVENHGVVLSKNELLERVWANQFVEENNLTVHISAVRKALGERRGANQFIVTVPGRGYSFVGELSDRSNGEIIIESHKFERIIIEQTENFNETPPPKAINRTAATNRAAFFLITGALVLCVLGIFGWWINSHFVISKTEGNSLKQTKLSRLTNNGRVVAVALSPDGKYFVFAEKESDGQSLWLRQIEIGSQTRIIEPKPLDYLGLTISPDQNYIYCATFQANQADPVVFRVPFLGGATQELPFYSGVAVSFSPDGSKIAFNQSHSASLKETHLVTADANGANPQILVRLKDSERSFNNYQANAVAWSPDGAMIAAIVEDAVRNDAIVTGFDSNTGVEIPLSQKRWAGVSHIAWTADGENLAIAAREKDSSNNQIWLIARRTGEVRQITNDLSSYGFLATAKNARTTLAVQKNVSSTIYVADFDLQKSALAPRAVFTESGGLDNVEWATEGRLLYSSSATGKREIWRVETNGANPAQLTADARVAFGISLSPDGEQIVFNSWREDGKLLLYLSGTDGKNMRQIAAGVEDVYPNFATDNRIIFQRGLNNKTLTLWRTTTAGETPVQLTHEHSTHPVISPDGTRVAYYFMDNAKGEQDGESVWRIGLISSETGELLGKISFPKFVTERQMRWHPSGEFIAQIFQTGENTNLLLLPVAGAGEKLITNLGKGDVSSFAFSRNARQIAFVLANETRDVVSISDF